MPPSTPSSPPLSPRLVESADHSRSGGRLLERARELGPAGLLLLAHAFFLLLAARVALKLVPVRHVIAWKQRPLAHALPSTQAAIEAATVRRAILTVARHSPIRFVCFPQCLAAAALLRARGVPSRLHYGVSRSPNPGGKLITHTWLEAAGQIIIGGEVAADYSTLAVYE